jgi:ParB-like chromosome segregation protein Spo0J
LALLRGLARSTIANKLRLLTLPAGIRRSIEQGEVNERQAMALLALPAPEKAREAIAQPRRGSISLTSLVKDARKGKGSAELRPKPVRP